MSIKDRQSLVGTIFTAKPVIGRVGSKRIISGSVSNRTSMIGSVSDRKSVIFGSADSSAQLNGDVRNQNQLTGHISVGSDFEHIVYDGPYEAMPHRDDQVVNTKGRLMREDFTVKAVPYAEITNNADGITITIGG